MGCDIHCFVEKKDKDNWVQIKGFKSTYEHKKGEKVDEIYDYRWYYLFAKLADVRNYHKNYKPWKEVQGLPDDISLGLKEYFGEWDSDIHSCSSYTLSELINLRDDKDNEDLMEFFDHVIPQIEHLSSVDSNDDVRIVFGFDN